MSFNPLSVPSQPYIGAPFRLSAGYKPSADDSPAIVPVTIQWLDYGVSQSQPNAAVALDLSGASNRSQQLSVIRSLYIDNTGSDGSIYVYFPDTQFTVTCAPYSTQWCPVLSNSKQFTVIGKNFTTGDLSQTRVFACNFPVSPGGEQELQITYPQVRCSPQLERGLNLYGTGFTSPAVGDQFQFLKAPLNTLNGTISQNLFGTPYLAGGWITLTDIYLGIMQSSVGTAGRIWESKIASNGIGGTLLDLMQNTGSTTIPITEPLFSKSDLQYRLNAAETWTWAVSSANAGADGNTLYAHFGFSYQGAGIGGGITTGSFGTLGNAETGWYIIGDQFLGVTFTPVNTLQITAATWIFNNSPATASGRYEIWSDNAGNPGVLLGTSDTYIVNYPAGVQQVRRVFPTPVALNGGTAYWVVLHSDAGAGGAWQFCGPVAGYSAGHAATVAALPGTGLPGGGIWQVNLEWQSG